MRILITGGAGFIGTNAAAHFLRQGHDVHLVDNFSRRGSADNLRWLGRRNLPGFSYGQGDVRWKDYVSQAVGIFKPDVVLHLAAQVAVTTSVADPRADFEVNALGTLNVLEAVRKHAPEAVVLYTSTNKVYGEARGNDVVTEYRGVNEQQPVHPISPYGCSKACADQYMQDYARIYGLKTVVFRCSCIYGPHQNGTEDQGWVAHFARAAIDGSPVTIYGDGRQVRDLLFVDDLVRLFETAIDRIDVARGDVFNVGGGPRNARSVLNVVKQLEGLSGHKAAVSFADWRPGDQRLYISDATKAQKTLGWWPEIEAVDGIERLYRWMETRATAHAGAL